MIASGRVSTSDLRGEETEIGRLASEETEFPFVDQQFAAFFHTLGNNAKSFNRWLKARDSGRGGVQSPI